MAAVLLLGVIDKFGEGITVHRNPLVNTLPGILREGEASGNVELLGGWRFRLGGRIRIRIGIKITITIKIKIKIKIKI